MALSNERQFVSQRTFRSANERMQALVGDIVPAEQLIPFLCECADDACLGRVAMKRADYGDIHGDRDRYTILRDHQMADGEHVVEQRPLFDVVSKAAVV